MRILILTISYPPNVGGVETHLADLTRWLQTKEDLEVDVLTYQPITTHARGPAFEKKGRLRVFRISWIGHNLFHRFESKPVLQFLYLAPRLLLAAIFQIFRHGKYNVIHAHGLAAIWVAGQLKRFWKIPVLGSLHTVYLFRPHTPTGQKIRKVLLLADHVLSCADAGVIQSRAYGIPEERVGRFTYWVDQNIFSPDLKDEARRKQSLPENRMICLFVGRLIDVKGVRILLELAQKHADILFLTAGDGPMEQDCIEAAKRLPNLRHLGCVANHKLALLYSACDLLLVPSLFTEGIPRVICEALSCGLPVIASDRGGSREALNKGVGLIAEPTMESFSAAIGKWCGDGGTTPSIRQACRAHAIASFGTANVQVIEDCLRRLCRA